MPGNVLIAPGGEHLTLKKIGTRTTVRISKYPEDTLYHPCVDVLFHSVAEAIGHPSMGIVLTGMRSNGVEGMAAMKAKGAVCLAQDADSCVVYGMPKAVIDAGLADHIAPIDRIADELLSFF